MKPNPTKPNRSSMFNVLLILVLLAATGSALAATRYVWQDSPSPGPPYTNWTSAAHVIQDAVDAAQTGDTVQVAGGVYATGGRAVGTNLLVNRVAIDRAITVESLMGPEVTIIQGYQVPGIINGDGAIRCVYLTNGATLSGFTLTNGATSGSGGGVWCESTNSVVSNCILAGNSAAASGGGAAGGTLNNCTLRDNFATGDEALGGGVYGATLNNCLLTGNSATGVYGSGGGAYLSTLNNCTLTGNSAWRGGGACGHYYGSPCTLNNCTLSGNSASYGGGAFMGRLNNCTLTGNSAEGYGGGAQGGRLNNCTLTGNSAGEVGGGAAGDAYGDCTLNNCILYFNTAANCANYSGGPLNYCCTTPLPAGGTGNITDDPELASASHLSATSPCRGAGSAGYASGTDIDGEPWLRPPSIGCDEYHPGAVTGPLSVGIAAAFTNVAVGFTVELTAFIDGRTTASVWDFGDGLVVSNRPYAPHAWTAAGDYTVRLRAYNESHPEGVSATVTVHVVLSPVHYVAAGAANPLPPYASWATAARNIQDAVDVAEAGGTVLVTNGTYAAGGRAAGMSLLANRAAVEKPLTLRSVNGPEFTVIQGYQVPGTTNGDGAIRCVYLADGVVLSGFTLTNGATSGSGGGVWCESANAVASNCVVAGNSAAGGGGGASGGTLNNCTLTGNSALEGGGAFGSTLYNCTLTGNSAGDEGGGAFLSTLYNCTLTGNLGGGANHCTLNNCTLTGNSGGGAWGCTLNNCTLTGNSAGDGGGAYESTLNNCTLTGNSATDWGGGAFGSTLYNCTLTSNSAFGLGGGAYSSTLSNCSISGNSASEGGGAAGEWNELSTLNSCTLTGNSAFGGGGAYWSTLNNCTLTGNRATGTNSWNAGGGAYSCALNNCIVYLNTAGNGGNYLGDDWIPGILNYCCTTPQPTNGFGNITNTPLFVDYAGGNLRLQSNSPCINAGNNSYAVGSTDLDGPPRIVSGTVDIGAYEFQGSGSLISYAWLQHYGLPADGSADSLDPDGDGLNNWQEWRCGTCPTNVLSVLRLLSASPAGTNVTVSWQSVAGVSYFLERSTNLSATPPFTPLATDIPGQANTTTYTDTNAAPLAPLFYRVGVRN